MSEDRVLAWDTDLSQAQFLPTHEHRKAGSPLSHLWLGHRHAPTLPRRNCNLISLGWWQVERPWAMAARCPDSKTSQCRFFQFQVSVILTKPSSLPLLSLSPSSPSVPNGHWSSLLMPLGAFISLMPQAPNDGKEGRVRTDHP